jgi:hypothetical protein
MKPFSYAIIVLMISAFLLSACGGSPQPTAVSQPPTAATQAGYPAPVKQATPAGYPAAGQPGQPDTSAAYPPDGIILQVVKADGKVAPIDFRGLSALAKEKVTLENKSENVSKLSDALGLGGVTSYTKVTVTASNGSLELTKDQVAQAYLDVPANGIIRLLVQGIPQNKWLTGVSGIKVQ